MSPDSWVVEIKGPQGVKLVELPDSLIMFMAQVDNLDPYVAAVQTAYTHLRLKDENK